MLVQRQWNQESEVFEVIAEELGGLDSVRASSEVDSYGNQGTISVRFMNSDGSSRLFQLSLHEVL